MPLPTLEVAWPESFWPRFRIQSICEGKDGDQVLKQGVARDQAFEEQGRLRMLRRSCLLRQHLHCRKVLWKVSFASLDEATISKMHELRPNLTIQDETTACKDIFI